jgi:hypothetical protein
MDILNEFRNSFTIEKYPYITNFLRLKNHSKTFPGVLDNIKGIKKI